MARPSPLVPFVLALLAPGLAWAGGTAVVTPLVAKGVDEKVTRNLTGLISSELDFSGAFDTVNELSQAPSSLNASCVTSTSCLAGIAKTAGADTVVTGTVAPGSKGVSVNLVFFDAKKGAITKTKSWDIESSVASQAESAPRMVKEMLGAASPAVAAAKEVEKVTMDTEEENDFSFSDSSKPKTKMTPTSKTTSKVALEDLPDDEEELDARYAAEQAAKAKAAADAAAKAKAAADAAAKAEADRKARVEAEARAKAAAEAAAKAEADRKAKALAEAERREREEEEAQARADAAAAAAAAKAKADAGKKTSAPVLADVDEELEEDPVEEPVAKKTTTSSKSSTSTKSTKPPEEMSDEELEAQLAGFKLGGTVEEAAPVATTSTKSTSTKSTTTKTTTPPKVVVVEEPDEDLEALEDEEYGSTKSVSYADEEPEDEAPVAKSKSKSSYDEDEDEPKPKAKAKSWDDEEDEPKPKAKAKSSYDEDEDEPKAKSKSRYDDEEEDEPRSKSKSRYDDDEPAARSKSKSRYDEDEPKKNHVELTARAGYSRYDNFNFVNYGGELAIPVAGGVFAVVGLEGASTNRGYTDKERQAIADQNGITAEEVEDWNTILPFNLGVQYKATAKKVQPYGGADLTITPYTANFDVAFGARARGGVDFLVSDNFGINLDLALGFMSGEKLQFVAPGVPNIGFQPRLCVGTVIAF